MGSGGVVFLGKKGKMLEEIIIWLDSIVIKGNYWIWVCI